MRHTDGMARKYSGIKDKKGQGGNTVLALFVLVAITTSFPFAKQAQGAADRHGIGFDLGQVLLMGDFSKSFSDSLGLGLTYSYEASDMFGLLLHVNASNHSNADESNKLMIKGVSPDLRVNLAYFDKLVLYGFGGFGLFKIDETINRVEGSALTLGLNLGTGFLLELSPHFGFGTSLGFHSIFAKTDSKTVTESNPGGFMIGGTYLGVFLNLFYLF